MNKRYTSSTLMARVMQKSKPYLFLLPALFFIVMFTYYPFVETIINSFFKLNNKAPWKREEIEKACDLLNIPIEEVHLYFFSN